MDLQQKVNQIREVMHLSNSIISMHTMLRLRGIDAGVPRRPLLMAEEATAAKIKSGLKGIGVME